MEWVAHASQQDVVERGRRCCVRLYATHLCMSASSRTARSRSALSRSSSRSDISCSLVSAACSLLASSSAFRRDICEW